jgi:anhydro-N-acetylmuramic acid kinase
VHNDFLCSEINKQNQGRVGTTLELGIDPDYVEAICFGWLAKQRIENKSFNLSSVTGSNGKVYLGRIYEPSK